MSRRNSTIELLRIVAMVAIVAHHYVYHGGVLGHVEIPAAADLGLRVFGSLGRCGVDVFVLIGAYFMAQDGSRRPHVARVAAQVWTTSVAVLLVVAVVASTSLGPMPVLKSIFPLLFTQYWFATAYVVLMLASPGLNLLIRALGWAQHAALVVVVFGL